MSSSAGSEIGTMLNLKNRPGSLGGIVMGETIAAQKYLSSSL